MQGNTAVKKGMLLALAFCLLNLVAIYYVTSNECNQNLEVASRVIKNEDWSSLNNDKIYAVIDNLQLSVLKVNEAGNDVFEFDNPGQQGFAASLFNLGSSFKVKDNQSSITFELNSKSVGINFIINCIISTILILLAAFLTSFLCNLSSKNYLEYIKNALMNKRYYDLPFEDLTENLIKSEEETKKSLDEASKRIEHLETAASIDSLTGLYNRHTFRQNFEQILSKKTPFTNLLGLIKATEIRQINADRGFIMGDKYIHNVADLIKNSIKRFPGANAYRISGADIAILMPNSTKENVEAIADDLKLQIDQYKRDNDLETVCYAGYTLFDSKESFENIMARTDLALAKAQTGPINGYVIQTENLDNFLQGELHWRTTVQDILNRNAITLYYQPIRIINMQLQPYTEIFARFSTKDGEKLPTQTVLAAAQRHDLLVRLEERIIETIISKYREVSAKQPNQRFGINLSANAIISSTFLLWLERTLLKNSDVAPNLVFEIDEELLECNIHNAERLFNIIHRTGALTSISHFGTGVRSFQLFQNLKAKYIKLDPNIIQFSREDTRKIDQTLQTFFNMINNSAHRIGCGIIAEAVEHPYQVNLLEKLLVDGIQGWAYQQPKELVDIIEIDRKNSAKESWE